MDKQRKDPTMSDPMCMNHPDRPADDTGTDYGPLLCTPCARSAGLPADRPAVVTLCGSMRFVAELLDVAAAETAAGAVVLAPFVVVPPDAQNAGPDATRKRRLDALHRHKIRLSDRVIVVSDATGYIGESTRAEIAYARGLSIPVEFCRVARTGTLAAS